MNNYRYILEPYKGINSRHTCPNCNKRNVFAYYIDSRKGERLPEKYGRCNRQDKCSYHVSPYYDGYSQMIYEQEKENYKANWKPIKPQPKQEQKPAKEKSFVPFEKFKQTLFTDSSIDKIAEINHFVKYLIALFGEGITAELVSKYFIGTSKHEFRSRDFPNYKSSKGANIFWQIDISGRIRTGKIMLYNPETGKRIKVPFNHVTWVHKSIKQPEFELKQSFFGEHLLKGNTKPVAIAESEKTAIIASVYYPQFIWIAAGNLNGLNAEKCKALEGRQVILYPDLSKPKPDKPTAFEVWSAKAREFRSIAHFTVNDLLERKADDEARNEGCDLADYLINFDYKEFQKPERQPEKEIIIQPTQVIQPEPFEFGKLMPKSMHKPDLIEAEPKQNWSFEIDELEKYFSLAELPIKPIRLNQCSIIESVPMFLESHFATVKANNGSKHFLPYLNRLYDLKRIFENNKYLQR